MIACGPTKQSAGTSECLLEAFRYSKVWQVVAARAARAAWLVSATERLVFSTVSWAFMMLDSESTHEW